MYRSRGGSCPRGSLSTDSDRGLGSSRMPESRARRRALRIGLVVLALLPVVTATVTAGIITLPSRIRPCATEYANEMAGRGPLHLTLGPDDRLYASAALDDEILAFDPQTHRM